MSTMPTERPAGRDPDYLLDLLWRTTTPPRRGPRGALTLDGIVGAAVRIADTDGLDAVSMRRIAESLGVTTMSLYRYVPSKDDLLDLMFEMGTTRPDTTDWPDDWRGRLERFAHGTRSVLRQRPWMLDVPISGPPMGPNNLAWMDAALGSLAGTGLSEDDMMGVLTILSGYVLQETQQEITMSRAAPRTGLSYEEWGQAYGRLLDRVVREGRYPAVARVIEAGVFESERQSPDDDFAYGLAFILDSVEALIGRRAAEDAPRPGAVG
jgi:AcrR family transcriptional regulator